MSRAALVGLGIVAGLISAALLAAPPPRRGEPAGAAAPAPAAAGNARITLSADGRAIYIVGPIMDGSFLQFDALLQTAPLVRTVYLASPGGLTIEGRLISALVRKRQLGTYVETYCASACTQVFVAGHERVLGPHGELGFHQAIGIDERGRTTQVTGVTRRALSPHSVFGVSGNDTLRLAYQNAGIAPGFIAAALARPHNQIWLPSAAELRTAQVITRQAERAEFAPPPGAQSPGQIGAILANLPFWQRAKGQLPAAHADAAQAVWRRVNSGTPMDAAISTARAGLVIAAWPLLARADDQLAGAMLKLYAEAARRQRLGGYPLCQSADLIVDTPDSQLDPAFEAAEDQLLIALFDTPRPEAPLSPAAAQQIFAKEVVPQLIAGLEFTGAGSAQTSCQTGFAMFEAIDRLPAGTRVTAYRALLSLPGLLDGAAPA